MVNYILLEGIEMYVFIFLFITLAIMSLIGFWVGVKKDDDADKLKDLLHEEREKNIVLNRENMRLKLKYGELKVGEKVDV